jgi:hypothetical protein
MAVARVGNPGEKGGEMDIVGLRDFEVEELQQAGKRIGLGTVSPFGIAVDFFKLPVKQSGQFRGFVVGVVQIALS